MHNQPILRFAPFLAALTIAVGIPSAARADKFPPLNSPSSAEHLPGKLVWVDLFTTNPDAASKFYCSLLGWTASSLDQKGKGYVVFSNDGRPVAGLAPRSVKGGNHPSRWIGYYSVADMGNTLALVTKDGGVIHVQSHNFPDRGYQAIVGDKDSIPIGLLESSSGDAVDSEPRPGDWNWFELYVKDPRATADFYHDAIGMDVASETNSDRKSDYVLSSAKQARGGIASMPAGDDVKPSWLGIIRVANLDDTLAKVPALGGEVLVAPHSVEFGSRFAIILDPTGGTVGLVQYMDNANPANNP
jgi:predicted enzyme related to lactoylglutathione lyase